MKRVVRHAEKYQRKNVPRLVVENGAHFRLATKSTVVMIHQSVHVVPVDGKLGEIPVMEVAALIVSMEIVMWNTSVQIKQKRHVVEVMYARVGGKTVNGAA
tara:strand:+ start:1139 stop:1441 length:303 start_codon:yes stop_codon:yes gene_type:complete